MAVTLANAVSFYAVSGGTGNFVFGAARSSFLTLQQAIAQGEIADGATVPYLAQDQLPSPQQREWGHGTVNAATNSISRTTILGWVDASGKAGSGTPLDFTGTSPPLVSLTALAGDIGGSGFIPAPSNLTFYVATTGSDTTGDGSASKPWATPQHAVNVANTYDWLNLYVPTINIAGGIYTDNGLSMVVSIPAIRNSGLGAFATFNFTAPVTFSVAATGGALCVQTAPLSSWQFQGSKLTCDCFGTALSLAGDLSLECDVDFQDTGTNNFQGANLVCINPQTTGQIACFQAKTWQVLCPKLSIFVLFNTLTTPNFINNVIFKLPVGGVDMSTNGGAFFAGNQFGTFYLGGGCSFTGGAATGGGQYSLQGFSLLGMSTALLAQVPGDPNLNLITGAGSLSDGGNNEKVFNVDPFYNYQQPSTGFTLTIANKDNEVILDPSGTLATGTVKMPVAPQDGQKIVIRSSQIITALTVSANTGQSLGHGAPTTLAAGTSFSVIYRLANTTWYFGS